MARALAVGMLGNVRSDSRASDPRQPRVAVGDDVPALQLRPAQESRPAMRPDGAVLRESDGWTVEPVDAWEARQLIRTLHYSRSVTNTATYAHGLRRAWQTYGAALWIPPTRRAAESVAGDEWEGVLCLSRLVVAPEVPTNGASFLLGRSMRLVDRRRWPILLTYADTRLGHSGAIYRATNWQELGPVKAGDLWIHRETGEQRGRKRGGQSLTFDEMTALGFVQAPAAPKIKFVHRAAG